MYSGFLGSPDQVSIIQRLYREYPSALRLVDPVMGDAGQMYPTYTPELCEAMGALADGADVLMPNLTEASILTKRDYPGQDLDDAAVTELLDALLGLGAKNVVLKGIDTVTARSSTTWRAPKRRCREGRACARQAAVHDPRYG